jgi:hypothetical protein
MKKIIIIILLFICNYSFSQENYKNKNFTTDEIHNFLKEKYSIEEINEMKVKNSELYNFYCKSFKEGIILVKNYKERYKDKEITTTKLNVTLNDNEIFNYLKYNIQPTENHQYFSINNDSTLVIIKGKSTLKN